MKSPSPLFVWKLILVVILPVCIYMYVADPMEVVFERRDNKLLERFKDIHFTGDEVGIIFFGNSLMNTALPRQESGLNAQLGQEFRKAGITKPVLAREITGGGVTLSNLNRIEEKLVSIRTSVVVIQSEMLVPRGFTRKAWPRVADRMRLWSGVVGSQVLGKGQQNVAKHAEQPKLVIEKDVPTPREQMKRAAERRRAQPMVVAKRMWENQVVSTNHPQFIAGRDLIQRLIAKGIRVVIVELPVSETAVKLSSSDYFEKRTKAIQTVVTPGVMHVVYPRILPDEYFLDYSHVRLKGRDEFVEWFFPVLAQELRKHERDW